MRKLADRRPDDGHVAVQRGGLHTHKQNRRMRDFPLLAPRHGAAQNSIASASDLKAWGSGYLHSRNGSKQIETEKIPDVQSMESAFGSSEILATLSLSQHKGMGTNRPKYAELPRLCAAIQRNVTSSQKSASGQKHFGRTTIDRDASPSADVYVKLPLETKKTTNRYTSMPLRTIDFEPTGTGRIPLGNGRFLRSANFWLPAHSRPLLVATALLRSFCGHRGLNSSWCCLK